MTEYCKGLTFTDQLSSEYATKTEETRQEFPKFYVPHETQLEKKLLEISRSFLKKFTLQMFGEEECSSLPNLAKFELYREKTTMTGCASDLP